MCTRDSDSDKQDGFTDLSVHDDFHWWHSGQDIFYSTRKDVEGFWLCRPNPEKKRTVEITSFLKSFAFGVK